MAYAKTEEGRKKQREYMRNWTERNRKRRNELNRQSLRRKKDWLKEIKSKLKCERCGFSHSAALDFHHKDPDQKEITISDALKCWGKEKILTEIEKCEVLCRNCHAIEHYMGD